MKIFIKVTAVLLTTAFAVFSFKPLCAALLKEKEGDENAIILELRHADTFDGGTGSRKRFLLKVAEEFERENEGVFISVIQHTAESILTVNEGERGPDLVSFGIGAEGVEKIAKPLKTQFNNKFFKSGQSGGETFFYPYAYGMYMKISGGKGAGTVISEGRGNLPLFAAKYAGENYDASLPSSECYVAFFAGKYGAMIGTNRDVYRLSSRGVDFKIDSVFGVTDLVQYIAVTASDKKRAEIAEKFAEYLISDEVQLKLKEVGLFSPTGRHAEYENEYINKAAGTVPEKVLSGILPNGAARELRLNDGKDDFFEKFIDYLA